MAITCRLLSVGRMLGQRLSDVDESTLDRLVHAQQAETDQLDFKSTWTVKADSEELRKDVCAFANARGGLIIFGVKEKNSIAAELTPFEQTGELQNQVAGILFSGCRPTPRFELSLVPSNRHPGRIYALLAIPQSSEAPHARVRNQKEGYWLDFPVRFESATRFLNENELATRYRARFQAERQRAKRIDELDHSFPPDSGSNPEAVAMSFSSVPSSPGEAAISRELVDRWRERLRGLHDGSLSFGCSPRFDVSQFRFRRRAIRIGSDEDYVEFHFDGSVTAYCIARATGGVLGLERLGPLPACLEQKFVAIRVAALHGVAAEFALDGSGASGALTTRVRLVGTRPHLGTPQPVMLVTRRGGSLVPVSNHPSLDVWTESNTPLDVLCGSVSRSTVESWKTTMDELSHCIGLPGSDLFCAAEIVPEEWDNDAQMVSSWIEKFGLAELPVPPRSG